MYCTFPKCLKSRTFIFLFLKSVVTNCSSNLLKLFVNFVHLTYYAHEKFYFSKCFISAFMNHVILNDCLINIKNSTSDLISEQYS